MKRQVLILVRRAYNKMTLYSNGLFSARAASGCIDNKGYCLFRLPCRTKKRLFSVRRLILLEALIISGILILAGCGSGRKHLWEPHDMNRPVPPIITAGEKIGQPPSDAIVLFDGKDLSQWRWDEKADWKVENGYVEVGGKGSIYTKEEFGDVQLHIEWATPAKIENKAQHRGNSGVFMMGKYEIQILDNYNNRSYADGMAGALYGQVPPLVNVCREPGKWQSYDIVFRRPIFKKSGKLIRPARATIFQNGVLVQDCAKFSGFTVHAKHAVYEAHGDKGPIMLQEHKCPVRFRNIWVRELADCK